MLQIRRSIPKMGLEVFTLLVASVNLMLYTIIITSSILARDRGRALAWGAMFLEIDWQSTVVFSKEWTFCAPFLACGIAHAHMKETGWWQFCRLKLFDQSFIDL